jgi:hypothetical protein
MCEIDPKRQTIHLDSQTGNNFVANLLLTQKGIFFYGLGELLGDAKLSDIGQHRPNPDNYDRHRLGIDGG